MSCQYYRPCQIKCHPPCDINQYFRQCCTPAPYKLSDFANLEPTTLYGIPYDSQTELNKAYLLKNKISEELEEKYNLLKLPFEKEWELSKKQEEKEMEPTLLYREYLGFCMETRERLLKKKYSFIQILFRIRKKELKTNQEQIDFWKSEINSLTDYVWLKYVNLRKKIKPKFDELSQQKEEEIKKIFLERIKEN